MKYKPATALVTSSLDSDRAGGSSVLIEAEDVPGLLDQIAGLIGVRASRQVEREMRMAHASS